VFPLKSAGPVEKRRAREEFVRARRNNRRDGHEYQGEMSVRDEEPPEFKPRSPQPRSAPVQRVPRFRQFVLARAQQRFSRLAGAARSSTRKPLRGGGRTTEADVPVPGPGAQRCIIKARVVPLRARGMAAARLHLDYIERDGVEQDGSPGRLYSGASSEVRGPLVADVANERHQFRFIVSPENGHEVDLTTFARDLMARMERDTGRRLVWGAVNHHDTDNPHVHIVVRGVDARGTPVRLERAYIAERFRWQAQHLLTRELGRRTGLDIALQLNREVRQERYTTLDRRLSRELSPDGFVDMRRLSLTTDRAMAARFVGRLTVLAKLGLAHKPTAASWQLAAGWEGALRALGERGDIIKRMHAALGERANPAQFSIVDVAREHPVIEGVVRRKGLHDELKADLFVVIETARGRAHYVRIDAAAAEAVREGQMVRIERTPHPLGKPIDEVLQAIARQFDGVFDPARYRAELAASQPTPGGARLEPDAIVAANIRRLERLEGHQLAVRGPDGKWLVPQNLVDLLAERDRSRPRLRTKVAVLGRGPTEEARQVRPSWLDSHRSADPTRAGYGFGAEIAAAVREREAFLTGLGIPAAPTTRRAVLEQRARASLGEDLARAMGGTFVPEPEPGFRGRVLPCDTGLGGPRFVQVVDEAARRVAVLPAAQLATGLEGRLVELSRDTAGQLVAQQQGISRGD
jgi:type IV secretory pathway VirD2 relaxase